MATKLYKQTFKRRVTAGEVHEEIGRRGGLVLRIDQSARATTAYFEADEQALRSYARESAENVKEASLKEITKI